MILPRWAIVGSPELLLQLVELFIEGSKYLGSVKSYPGALENTCTEAGRGSHEANQASLLPTKRACFAWPLRISACGPDFPTSLIRWPKLGSAILSLSLTAKLRNVLMVENTIITNRLLFWVCVFTSVPLARLKRGGYFSARLDYVDNKVSKHRTSL